MWETSPNNIDITERPRLTIADPSWWGRSWWGSRGPPLRGCNFPRAGNAVVNTYPLLFNLSQKPSNPFSHPLLGGSIVDLVVCTRNQPAQLAGNARLAEALPPVHQPDDVNARGHPLVLLRRQNQHGLLQLPPDSRNLFIIQVGREVVVVAPTISYQPTSPPKKKQ